MMKDLNEKRLEEVVQATLASENCEIPLRVRHAIAHAVLKEVGVVQVVTVPQEAPFWRGITLYGVHFDADVRKGAVLVRAKDRTP